MDNLEKFRPQSEESVDKKSELESRYINGEYYGDNMKELRENFLKKYPDLADARYNDLVNETYRRNLIEKFDLSKDTSLEDVKVYLLENGTGINTIKAYLERKSGVEASIDNKLNFEAFQIFVIGEMIDEMEDVKSIIERYTNSDVQRANIYGVYLAKFRDVINKAEESKNFGDLVKLIWSLDVARPHGYWSDSKNQRPRSFSEMGI